MENQMEIRNVWNYNLDSEINNIMNAIDEYSYVSMDTEFPGIVARCMVSKDTKDTAYQTIRYNINMMKLIQLGITVTNANGDGDSSGNNSCTCWQFNFQFSLSSDVFACDSIDLLANAGIDFNRFEQQGIDAFTFGEAMMMSGLFLNEDIKWISFHATYDFGYILKTVTQSDLPVDEVSFHNLLRTFFPNIYDIKYIMSNTVGFTGSLNSLAESLYVKRIGTAHQAGSDSLLTSKVFFEMLKNDFNNDVGKLDDYNGKLYGLDAGNNKGNGYNSSASRKEFTSSATTTTTTKSLYSTTASTATATATTTTTAIVSSVINLY